MQLTLGTLINNRYRLVAKIAEGGMGIVYRAHQLDLDRPVAIKCLGTFSKLDKESQQRLEREAAVLSQLRHKNIVSVYNFGFWNDLPYIVLELIDGISLQTLLDDGPMAPDRVWTISKQVLSALQHAHAFGVIHRDLKPANIMISQTENGDELVKVVDFGLVKVTSAFSQDEMQVLTMPGVAVGTALYMSPEQCTGATVDARSDLYSLGCVLYHSLAGVAPFSASAEAAVMFRHLHAKAAALTQTKEQDITLLRLEAAIARCMQKAPEDRFESATQMLSELEDIQKSGPLADRVMRWTMKGTGFRGRGGSSIYRRWQVIVAILLPVMAVFSLTAWINSRQLSNREKTADKQSYACSVVAFSEAKKLSDDKLKKDKLKTVALEALQLDRRDRMLDANHRAALYEMLASSEAINQKTLDLALRHLELSANLNHKRDIRTDSGFYDAAAQILITAWNSAQLKDLIEPVAALLIPNTTSKYGYSAEREFALNDVARAFVRMGEVHKAREIFQRVSTPHSPSEDCFIATQSEIALKQGKPEEVLSKSLSGRSPNPQLKLAIDAKIRAAIQLDDWVTALSLIDSPCSLPRADGIELLYRAHASEWEDAEAIEHFIVSRGRKEPYSILSDFVVEDLHQYSKMSRKAGRSAIADRSQAEAQELAERASRFWQSPAPSKS